MEFDSFYAFLVIFMDLISTNSSSVNPWASKSDVDGGLSENKIAARGTSFDITEEGCECVVVLGDIKSPSPNDTLP